MSKRVRCWQFAALALVAALPACGDDDPIGPVNELTLAQVIAQCTRGTVGDATTEQEHTGRVESADCIPIGTGRGRIEGWALPQSSFGAMGEVQIDLSAEFDAVIVIVAPDGTVLAQSDQDLGGDFGLEQVVLDKALDGSLPQYFIGVFSWPNEPAGDYTLRVGPIP